MSIGSAPQYAKQVVPEEYNLDRLQAEKEIEI